MIESIQFVDLDQIKKNNPTLDRITFYIDITNDDGDMSDTDTEEV